MYAVVLVFGFVNQGQMVDDAELVEVNHCYSRDTGRRRFVQVIYWGKEGSRRLHVREWHMLEKCQRIYRVAGRDVHPYTIIRRYGSGLQVIRARRFVVTHTFTDPEEDDRKLLPVAARRRLGR